MKQTPTLAQKISRDALISVFLYALPATLMFLTFYFTGSHPWQHHGDAALPFKMPHFLEAIFKNLSTWGLPLIMVVLGVIEFAAGLYENKWTKNERILDIVSFIAPKIFIRPLIAYFGLLVLPVILPGGKNAFSWIPFWWGFFIIRSEEHTSELQSH